MTAQPNPDIASASHYRNPPAGAAKNRRAPARPAAGFPPRASPEPPSAGGAPFADEGVLHRARHALRDQKFCGGGAPLRGL